MSGFGAICEGVAVDGRLFAGIRLRARRPRSQGVGAICERVVADGRPFAGIRLRAGRPRSQGGWCDLRGVVADGRPFAGIRLRAGRPRSQGGSQVVLTESADGTGLPFPTASPGPTGSARCFAAWPGRWRGRSSEIPVRSTCWRRPRRAPAGRRVCPRPGTLPGSA